ncbi:hypothetical protein N598_17000 [Klebsiella pneumoniae 303K]|nr:hypothetical protein N598_17000 [Klebsiella pneumoniae 303K]
MIFLTFQLIHLISPLLISKDVKLLMQVGGVLYLVVLEVIIQQLVCILETNANIVLL